MRNQTLTLEKQSLEDRFVRLIKQLFVFPSIFLAILFSFFAYFLFKTDDAVDLQSSNQITQIISAIHASPKLYLDDAGQILFMTSEMALVLKLTSSDITHLNQLPNQDWVSAIKGAIANNEASVNLKDDEDVYITKITRLPSEQLTQGLSYVLSFYDAQGIKAISNDSELERQRFLLMLIALFLATIMFFVILLKLKIQAQAKYVARSLRQLSAHSDACTSLSQTQASYKSDSDILEINELNEQLNKVFAQFFEKKHQLYEAELHSRTIEAKSKIYQIMANTDALTGINNRKFIDTLLRHEAIRSYRNKKPMSIVLFDIDNFKNINDTYGHSVGDVVLKRIANVFKANIRAADSIGRWDGEEFLLICPETSIRNAENLAEKIREKVQLLEFEQGLAITVSGGVAEFEPKARIEELVSKADDRLYRAKKKGKNKIVSSDY